VAEVICADSPDGLRGVIRDLMVALAAAGVTATCSQADGSRYGAIDADSNLPDVRIAVGGPEANGFTAEVLAAAGPGYAKALEARLATVRAPHGCGYRPRAAGRRPSARTRRARGQRPAVLIVAGTGPGELAAAVTALAQDVADALVDAEDPAPVICAPVIWARPAAGAGTAGRPGGCGAEPGHTRLRVTPDGTLHMSLMRSCSACPPDMDRRRSPDGAGRSSFAWQHWSHTSSTRWPPARVTGGRRASTSPPRTTTMT